MNALEKTLFHALLQEKIERVWVKSFVSKKKDGQQICRVYSYTLPPESIYGYYPKEAIHKFSAITSDVGVKKEEIKEVKKESDWKMVCYLIDKIEEELKESKKI